MLLSLMKVKTLIIPTLMICHSEPAATARSLRFRCMGKQILHRLTHLGMTREEISICYAVSVIDSRWSPLLTRSAQIPIFKTLSLEVVALDEGRAALAMP